MSERQMTIVLLVLMGAILLIGGGALYYLRFQELATLQEQAEKLNGQVTEAKRKRDAVKGLQATVAQLDEKIAKLLSQIPKFDPKAENDDFANLVDDSAPPSEEPAA